MEALTPEKRAEALYDFFGWQGGTVHQLARETGLTVSQILYDDLPYTNYLYTPFASGFIIGRNGTDSPHDMIAINKGRFDFWSGVINGYNSRD